MKVAVLHDSRMEGPAALSLHRTRESAVKKLREDILSERKSYEATSIDGFGPIEPLEDALLRFLSDELDELAITEYRQEIPLIAWIREQEVLE